MSGALLAAAVAGLAAADGSGAPGEPMRMWDRLREAYVEYFSADAADPIGLRTARFLMGSTVTLSASDLQGRLGEDVFAAYDAPSRTVLLDRKGLDDIRLSLHSAELQPERARPFIERTAGAVVHEVRHALDHARTGEAPSFLEHEWVAYADQALFLWRRLERDADYRGLEAFDRAVAERWGAGPGGGERWWTRPLPGMSDAKLKAAVSGARQALLDKATSQEANDWFLARALALGLDRFKAALSNAGYLSGVSLLDPPRDAAVKAREDLEHVWRELAVLRSSKLPPQEKERRARPLEERLDAAERLAAFWDEPERQKRMRDRLDGGIAEDRKLWETMHGH